MVSAPESERKQKNGEWESMKKVSTEKYTFLLLEMEQSVLCIVEFRNVKKCKKTSNETEKKKIIFFRYRCGIEKARFSTFYHQHRFRSRTHGELVHLNVCMSLDIALSYSKHTGSSIRQKPTDCRRCWCCCCCCCAMDERAIPIACRARILNYTWNSKI